MKTNHHFNSEFYIYAYYKFSSKYHLIYVIKTYKKEMTRTLQSQAKVKLFPLWIVFQVNMADYDVRDLKFRADNPAPRGIQQSLKCFNPSSLYI